MALHCRIVSPEQHARLMELFDQACGVPRPGLPAFLEGLTPTDQSLRPRLEAMLDIDARSQVFFDQTRGGALVLAKNLVEGALMEPTAPSATEVDAVPTPRQVGEYEILERIGAGGMGSVYRARQRSPDRVVALKMLHPWLVSTASLERFRFEAQALASLQHASIPQVYAVGQFEGAVYFAMELVTGPTLQAWARERSRTPRERVELLIRVCEAVHHAHLRGFVHRDLKPDNIRVTEGDVPQVLDFGISAGLGERSHDIAGTPAYMSPEQLMPGEPIDVRSDVYSLGVIAFELLGGQLPVVPPKSGLATLQALKQSPAPRLVTVAPAHQGELDHIVARALEVSPAHRYASAAELGEDLRRFLRREPVRAHPGGGWYRLTRFVQRNALVVTAASLVSVALVGGTVVSLLQSRRAEQASAQAATDAQRAKASLEFLTTVLSDADSDNGAGRDGTIGQALDRATRRLDDGSLDPHVEASVRASLANTYVGLGEWSSALRQATLALDAYEHHHLPDDEALAEVLEVVAEVRQEAGDTKGGVAAGLRAVAIEEGLHAVPHTHLGLALHAAAIALREDGQMAEAVALHLRAIAVERALLVPGGPTSDLADTLDQYGLTLVTIGQYDDAEKAHREALALNLVAYGPDHQTTAIDYHHLAWLEFHRGHLKEARALLAQALKVRLATLGPDHMRIGMQRNLEALVDLAEGDVAAAEQASNECLRIARKSFGEQFGRYARLAGTRVLVLMAKGQPDEALALADRITELATQRFGPDHYITLDERSKRATALWALGRHDEALREWRLVLPRLERSPGPQSKMAKDARERLAAAQREVPP